MDTFSNHHIAACTLLIL